MGLVHDWMFETADALPLTLPEPASGTPDGGSSSWFEPIAAPDGIDGFDPMFSEVEDDESTPIDDVNVYGRRHSAGDYDAGYFGWDGYDSNEGAYDPPQEPVPRADEDCRSVNDLRPANDPNQPRQPGEQQAIDRLRQNAIPETTRLLNSIPGGTVFTMPDGANVSIEELRTLWSVSDFEVLTNFNPGNGGPGQADYNGGNPAFRIDVNAGLTGYMDNPNGYTYYPLHELSHVVSAGRAYHAGGHGYEMNESYANALAVAISAAAGLPVNPFYLQSLPTGVQPGVTTTVGTGPLGNINPNSPCGS